MAEQLVTAPAEFAVLGLGTMGANIALNVESRGFAVTVWNRDPERIDAFLADHPEKRFFGAYGFEEVASAVARPRRILIMISAGKPVDDTLDKLIPLLDSGDVVIDGGNSHFQDTRRRAELLAPKGIGFLGVGISGGSEGARLGPSIMPGGSPDAYEVVRPVLEAIAGRTDAGPCVGYLGVDGAGHFVKMVHNGIEYADMQGIAEAYDLLAHAGLTAEDLARVFTEWNAGPLESFLVEITARILTVVDDETGGPLVDVVIDEAAQKGTGQWTAVAALELGVPAPSISAAVSARVLSSRPDERLAASRLIASPEPAAWGETDQLVADTADALRGSRICAFAQGMDLISAASGAYGWTIPEGEVARIWMGGCIIRSRFLRDIRSAFTARPDLPNLLLDEGVAAQLGEVQAGWRRALVAAQGQGIPVPVLSAGLAYFDAYRAARLPQNLTQAQRDYFGAHTYVRRDHPERGAVHTDWAAAAPIESGSSQPPESESDGSP